RGSNRTAGGHLLLDPIQDVGTLQHPIHTLPMPAGRHPEPEQRVVSDREERRLVGPELEHLSRPPEPRVERVPVVGSETGEEGHVVGAGEDVDGIELDDTEATEHPPEVADVDSPSWFGVGEALSRERHPAGSVEAQPRHQRIGAGRYSTVGGNRRRPNDGRRSSRPVRRTPRPGRRPDRRNEAARTGFDRCSLYPTETTSRRPVSRGGRARYPAAALPRRPRNGGG